MNVGAARVVLRERTVLEVADLAGRFLARFARPFAWLSLTVLAPALALTYSAALLWGWGTAWLLAFASLPLLRGPFVVLASRLVFEDEVRARSVLGPGLRGGAALSLLRVPLAVLALFAFLPGIWFGWATVFCEDVLHLERARLGAAVRRSQSLAMASGGDAIFGALLAAVGHGAAVLSGEVAGHVLATDLLQLAAPESLFRAGGSPFALASFFAAVPWLATFRFLLYLDVRTRTEGWDVQARFYALRAREDGP